MSDPIYAVVRSIRVEIVKLHQDGSATLTGEFLEIDGHPLIGRRCVVRDTRITEEECGPNG